MAATFHPLCRELNKQKANHYVHTAHNGVSSQGNVHRADDIMSRCAAVWASYIGSI